MKGPDPTVDGAAAADDAEENFSTAPVANIATPCQNPPSNGDRLVAAAKAKQAALMDKSSPTYQGKNKRGPVLSTVMDTTTGQIYYGQNHGEIPPDLNPILRQRVDEQEAWLAQQPRPLPKEVEWANDPGIHSEIYAMDQAIKAREKATNEPVDTPEKLNTVLGQMMLHNRSLDEKAVKDRGIDNALPPCCTHCKVLTRGIGTHNLPEK